MHRSLFSKPGGVTECLKSAYSCFVKACNTKGKKSVDACHSVGLLAHDGRALEGGPDPVAARRYYKKACKGGFAPSCFNLSALYIQGSAEVNKNMHKALKYAMRACELGHVWGCSNASRMYKLGDGTEKDEQKAEKLMNKAKELHAQQKEHQLKFGEWEGEKVLDLVWYLGSQCYAARYTISRNMWDA